MLTMTVHETTTYYQACAVMQPGALERSVLMATLLVVRGAHPHAQKKVLSHSVTLILPRECDDIQQHQTSNNTKQIPCACPQSHVAAGHPIHALHSHAPLHALTNVL